jgi:hypothetical protein
MLITETLDWRDIMNQLPMGGIENISVLLQCEIV